VAWNNCINEPMLAMSDGDGARLIEVENMHQIILTISFALMFLAPCIVAVRANETGEQDL
jgi:hypothetical protein